jgi:oleate hydratase
MKAHIVGGGFGGLAAAALLIRNADVPGQDITIYEADERMGGGFFLGGNATSGYNLPGSVFDSEFRCTFDLLAAIPSLKDPAISVKDEFFAFNKDHPFFDRAHIIDRNGNIVHGPHFGLTLFDGLALARLSLTPEAKLEGRRIQEFFSPRFFSTEFWLLFSTIMGSLPQHSATEFRRYINRTVRLLPNLSDMANIWRTPLNQYEAFIEPLVDWLQKRGLNFLTRAFVRDICFASLPGRMTVKPARLRTGRRRDLGRYRARRYRAGHHRVAGRRPFAGNNGRGAAGDGQRTVLGVVEAPRARAKGIRQS